MEFKKSAKPVYAYLEGPGSREYYLASAADKIYLSPDDNLDVKGFLLEEMFFKNTLDKLGVQVEVDHIGKYKDAGDLFTKTKMSPETKKCSIRCSTRFITISARRCGQARRMTGDQIKR